MMVMAIRRFRHLCSFVFRVVFTGAAVCTAQSVTVSWDPNPEPDIAGYRVFVSAGGTPSVHDAGSTNSYSLSNLSPGTYEVYVTAYNTAGLESDPSESVLYTHSDSPTDGNVKFLGEDTVIGGTWQGNYGRDGYMVIGAAISLPAYASVIPIGHNQWVWKNPATDLGALQVPNSQDRIAACWYSFEDFTVQLLGTDDTPRRVTIYALDWDGQNRSQMIEVLDANDNSILDSRSISNFTGGIYLSWEITQDVHLRVRSVDGPNAVISGIFFDSGSVASVPEISPEDGSFMDSITVSLSTQTPGAQIRYTIDGTNPNMNSLLYGVPFVLTNSATVKARAYVEGMQESQISSAAFYRVTSDQPVRFISEDTSRSGNWKGDLGTLGNTIARETANLPQDLSLTIDGASSWIWDWPAESESALERPYQPERIASTWYSDEKLTATIIFQDSLPRTVSLYCVDYDRAGRTQIVAAFDPISGAMLDSTELTEFENGVWLHYEVIGRATFELSASAGPNVVLSGIFID
jgi:hypothetical protein